MVVVLLVVVLQNISAARGSMELKEEALLPGLNNVQSPKMQEIFMQYICEVNYVVLLVHQLHTANEIITKR